MPSTTLATNSLFFALRNVANRLIHPRTFIFIADGKSRRIHIGTRLQYLMLSAALSLLAWSLFSTGAMVWMHTELSKPPVMVGEANPDTANGWQDADMQSLSNLDDDERIAVLEKRVQLLTQDRESLIENFTTATEIKKQELEKIISETGLNPQKLAKRAEGRKTDGNKMVGRDGQKLSANQGGPYLPLDAAHAEQRMLMGQLDRLAALKSVVEKLPLSRPIGSARLMSPFGTRYDPFTEHRATHTGMDFSGPHGTKILASNDGVVTYAQRHHDYGNMIDISHGLGVSTRYAHMSKILVRNGQHVKKGQVIGTQGATGRATGEHLHYEVRYNDVPLNPMKFMKAGKAKI